MLKTFHPPHENGNVLFLILIAVALFAALSYAITNSTRSSGSSSTEPAKVVASQIIQFGSQVKAEVQRLQLVGKIDATQLDFRSNVYSQWWATHLPFPGNPNCTSSNCRIFGSFGGRVPEVIFTDPKQVEAYIPVPYSTGRAYPGHVNIHRTNFVGVGTAADDIVLMIPVLSADVCKEIDKLIGMPALFTNATQETFASWGEPAGISVNGYWGLDATVLANPFGDENTLIQNQVNGCVPISNYSNTYFHVLVAR